MDAATTPTRDLPPRFPDPWRAPSDFAAAIAAAGLGRPDVTADGALHRFQVEGDRVGSRNGWYVLHLDSGCPAGAFGSWRTGFTHSWCAIARERQTPKQQAALRRLVERAKAQRDAETRERQTQAAQRAARIWRDAAPADPAHPYLRHKEIAPHGARQRGNALVLPIRVGDQVTSAQFIGPQGTKLFLAGGRIAGGCYLLDDVTRRPEVLVCEGFATGATLHEEIGARVYCAFNAGNLLPVARSVRARHPRESIILCADDDRWTDGNPGVTKARAAALAIGGKLLVPDFSGMDLSTKPTDWNDWYRLRRQAGRVPT